MFFNSHDEKDEKKERIAYLKDRFEVTYFVADGLATAPLYLVDKETGIEYLHVNGSTIPLLTPDGKPKVRP